VQRSKNAVREAESQESHLGLCYATSAGLNQIHRHICL